jgi:uncharacterized membrane protein YphA (DoxX/SURF4 family)
LEKWNGPSEQAEGVHGMAAGAFPFLKSIPPERFLKILAAGEVVTGALLLAPFVPNAVAGAALTGFSGSLLAMYARPAEAGQHLAFSGRYPGEQGRVDAGDRPRVAG